MVQTSIKVMAMPPPSTLPKNKNGDTSKTAGVGTHFVNFEAVLLGVSESNIFIHGSPMLQLDAQCPEKVSLIGFGPPRTAQMG